MTRSVNWSNGHQSGSRTAERPAAPAESPARRAITVSAPWLRLSRGMAIRAAIEARVFGKRLLTLDADITVLPAEERGTRGAAVSTPRVRELPSGPARPVPRDSNGSVGDLAAAARALESGAADLKAARERMP